MMKKVIGIIAMLFIGSSAFAVETDSTGLPGDHFSLEGAIEIFRNSKDLEDFEKAINKENNHVNNLDLNQDGEIDYLRVENYKEGDAHAVVIKALVNKDEQQDVAVIEIEKTGDEEAILQIIGDEAIFGEDVIAEPFEEEAQGGKGGPAMYSTRVRIIVNVWLWRPVRWLYGPQFVIWTSPYRWGYYPRWWKPWRPHPWRVHYGFGVRYRVHVHHVHVHRVVHAHRVYTPRRTTSVHVHRHYAPAHAAHKVSRSAGATKGAAQAGKSSVDRSTAPKAGQSNQNRSNQSVNKGAPASKKAVNHNTVRSNRSKANGTTNNKPQKKATKPSGGKVGRSGATKATKSGGGGKR